MFLVLAVLQNFGFFIYKKMYNSSPRSYQKNKERLQQKARESYQNLSEGGKKKKRQFDRD